MNILRIQDVKRITGATRTTIWRWEKKGQFPKRVWLGPNSVGWREDEIQAWIESRPRGTGGAA